MVSVNLPLADFVVSSTDVAFTVTKGKAAAVAGAVYVAGAPLAVLVGAILPQLGEQTTPFCVKVQLAPLFVASFIVVAVNCCIAFNATLADVGDTETVIGETAMEALVLAMAFAIEVAVNNTWSLLDLVGNGGLGGAVYVTAVPLEVLAEETVPHELSQEEVTI